MTYYRIQDARIRVEDLLNPKHQTSVSYTTDTERSGVSVCDSLESLARYLANTGIPFTTDWVVIGVRGHLSPEDGEDARLGELLIYPTEIISVEPMTSRLAGLIDTAVDDAYNY
jgi:hypothetical protein